MLNGESHVADIDYLTTLAGYVHWQLTGERAVGIGEASGMFPINSASLDYNSEMLALFSDIPEIKAMPWNIKDILPRVLVAGENAGNLSEKAQSCLIRPAPCNLAYPYARPREMPVQAWWLRTV